MRWFRYITLIAVILFISKIAIAQKEKVNPHKFNTDTWSYTERCNPCHVDDPEKNSATRNDFALSYEKDSLSSADSLFLSGVSKLCYACHDGTVAGFSHSGGFEENYGSDGSNHDHPVSIVYQKDSLSRYKLYNPETKMSGLGGTIAQDMLINGRVECTSCHDAHFSMTKTSCKSCPPGKNDEISSLWVKNTKSALCLICHDI